MIDWNSCVLWLENRYFTESYWWDRSKYRNDGVVHGAKWKDNAFYFNGSSNYVICGNNDVLNFSDKLTIEALIYPETTSLPQRIVDKRGDGVFYNLYITMDYGLLRSDLGSYVSSSYAIQEKKWQHIILTYNMNLSSENIKGYVNAKNVGNVDYSEPIDSNMNRLTVGAQSVDVSLSYYFKGKLALLRLYNDDLSEEKIRILYRTTYRKI